MPAFEPVSVSLDDTLVVETSRDLVTDEGAVQGLRYRSCRQPRRSSSPTQRAATARAGPGLDKYTEVPRFAPDAVDPDPATCGGATTPYDRAGPARLLPRLLSSPTTPTSNLTDADNATDRVPRTKRRRFCVQFASTARYGPHPRHPDARRGGLHARLARRPTAATR